MHKIRYYIYPILFLFQVNDKAGVCERFLKGFCPNGADCSQRHVIACPEFDRTGACTKGAKCGFPHIQKKSTTDEGKKKSTAPSKPKRKSLGTSEQNLKKSRVAGEVGRGTGRYFEQAAVVENSTFESQEITSSPASEAAMAGNYIITGLILGLGYVCFYI